MTAPIAKFAATGTIILVALTRSNEKPMTVLEARHAIAVQIGKSICHVRVLAAGACMPLNDDEIVSADIGVVILAVDPEAW